MRITLVLAIDSKGTVPRIDSDHVHHVLKLVEYLPLSQLDRVLAAFIQMSRHERSFWRRRGATSHKECLNRRLLALHGSILGALAR